jgi:hypothetical protein
MDSHGQGQAGLPYLYMMARFLERVSVFSSTWCRRAMVTALTNDQPKPLVGTAPFSFGD